MSTTSHTSNNPGSLPAARGRPYHARPMSTISGLLARMRAATHAHGTCLGELSVHAMAGPIAALEASLEANAAEAAAVDTGAGELVAGIKAIAADGRVDPAEQRWLARHCPNFLRLTAHHRHAANQLRG